MQITVKAASHEYPVVTGKNLLGRLPEFFDCPTGCKVAVITDDNVAPLYLEKVLSGLPDNACSKTVPHGEASKNWALAGELLEWLADEKMSRSDVVVALGGGVVGDLAGFVASVYMRGIDYVQVPTTLLAAIDSSVGGKTAVDLPAGKNMAGRIYAPRAVVFDTDTLSTLPKTEWKCGLGEAVKYGVLAGGEIFDILEKGVAEENLERLIFSCVDYKRAMVERDENEKGDRRLLNLGHTVGHAIETESALGFPHGVCVAMGIYVIARACVTHGILPAADYKRITAVLQKYGFPECPYSVRSVLPRLAHDKKLTEGTLKTVLVRGIGDCFIKEMTLDELENFVL